MGNGAQFLETKRGSFIRGIEGIANKIAKEEKGAGGDKRPSGGGEEEGSSGGNLHRPTRENTYVVKVGVGEGEIL